MKQRVPLCLTGDPSENMALFHWGILSPQIGLLDLGIVQEIVRLSFHDKISGLEHVSPLGKLEGQA